MDLNLSAIAANVTFCGSGEHKRLPNPLAPPSLRSDASDCDAVDPEFSQDAERPARLLKEAIRRGQVDSVSEGDFPRYAWGWTMLTTGDRMLFEARLTNSGQGIYKGYFIDLDDLLGKRVWVRRKLDGGSWAAVIE